MSETETPIEKLPEALQPVARRYGPALARMTVEQTWGWVELLARGRTEEAYRQVLEHMDAPELLAEWQRTAEGWDAAAGRTAQRHNLRRRALEAVLNALLTMALGRLGLPAS